MRQDIVVHRAEGGLRPVFHAFIECALDSTLEIWARVNGRDGRALLVGDLIELLAEYVRLHAESDQMYFGSEVFRGCREWCEEAIDSQIVWASAGLYP